MSCACDRVPRLTPNNGGATDNSHAEGMVYGPGHTRPALSMLDLYMARHCTDPQLHLPQWDRYHDEEWGHDAIFRLVPARCGGKNNGAAGSCECRDETGHWQRTRGR
jgi:hypothetical protein